MIFKSSILLIALSIAQTVFANGFMVNRKLPVKPGRHLPTSISNQLKNLKGFQNNGHFSYRTNGHGNLVSVSQVGNTNNVKYKWKFGSEGKPELFTYVKDGKGTTTISDANGQKIGHYVDEGANGVFANVRKHFNAKGELWKTTVKEVETTYNPFRTAPYKYKVKQLKTDGTYQEIFTKNEKGAGKTYNKEVDQKYGGSQIQKEDAFHTFKQEGNPNLVSDELLNTLNTLKNFDPKSNFQFSKNGKNEEGYLVSVTQKSVNQNAEGTTTKNKWKFGSEGTPELFTYVKDGKGTTTISDADGQKIGHQVDKKNHNGYANYREHYDRDGKLYKTTVKEASQDGNSYTVKDLLEGGLTSKIFTKYKESKIKSYQDQPEKFTGFKSTNGNQMQDDAQNQQNLNGNQNQQNGQKNKDGNNNVQNSGTADKILKYGGGSLLGLLLLGLLLNGTKKSQEPVSSEGFEPTLSSDPSFSTNPPSLDGSFGSTPSLPSSMGMGAPLTMASGGNMAPAIPGTSGSSQPPIFV